MKKILVLLLALILTISVVTFFTGCELGKKDNDTSVSDRAEDEDEDIDVDESEDDNDDEDIDEKEEREDEDEEEPDEVSLERGKIKGSVYTSKSLGIKIKPSDDYMFQTDEELETIMSLGQAILDADSISEAASLYDMMCRNPITGASINIVYENLEMTNSVNVSEKLYIKAVLKQAESMMSDYIKSAEAMEIEIDGVEYNAIEMHTNYGTVDLIQVTVVKKTGKHMASITFTADNRDTLEELIGFVSHI